MHADKRSRLLTQPLRKLHKQCVNIQYLKIYVI
jgi:hypothetical protein